MNRDSAEKPASAGKWILVIAGQPAMRDLLERFLQFDGHFVSTAADGKEGLEKARLLPIDLVVIDLDVPATAGLEIRAEFGSDQATARLPMLFVSSWLKPHDLQKSANAGADGFLTVPFSITDLHRMVNSLVGPAPKRS